MGSPSSDRDPLERLGDAVRELDIFAGDFAASLRRTRSESGGLEREVILAMRCLMHGRENDHSPMMRAVRRTLAKASRTWGIE